MTKTCLHCGNSYHPFAGRTETSIVCSRACMRAIQVARGASQTVKERLEAGWQLNGECWEWQRARNENGYGLINVGKRSRLAHRVAYAEFVGPVPGNLSVLHRCDNPSCIRPEHLFLGTQLDNMQDASSKGRIRTPALRGMKNPRAKLSDEDVRRIYESPLPAKILAVEHDISTTLVYMIRKGYRQPGGATV